MSLESAADYLQKLKSGTNFMAIDAHQKCGNCHTSLNEYKTGSRQMAGGDHWCSDCYFAELGMLVEQNPVVPPQIR